MTDLKRSLAAKRRVASGRRFEQKLDAMHRSYEMRKLGKVVPHYPRTVMVPGRGRVFAKGGAPVDYSGVLRIPLHAVTETPARSLGPVIGNIPQAIAFDAKVLAEKSGPLGVYHHDPNQRHQLGELIAFAEGGALAFLLFEDREERVLRLIFGADTFRLLAVGGKIEVRDPRWLTTTPQDPYDYRAVLGRLIR